MSKSKTETEVVTVATLEEWEGWEEREKHAALRKAVQEGHDRLNEREITALTHDINAVHEVGDKEVTVKVEAVPT